MKELDLKQQKLERTVWHRREIFENYLQAAGRYAKCPGSDTAKAYGESYLTAYMYAPENAQGYMEQADEFLRDRDVPNALSLIRMITPELLNSCEETK